MIITVLLGTQHKTLRLKFNSSETRIDEHGFIHLNLQRQVVQIRDGLAAALMAGLAQQFLSVYVILHLCEWVFTNWNATAKPGTEILRFFEWIYNMNWKQNHKN